MILALLMAAVAQEPAPDAWKERADWQAWDGGRCVTARRLAEEALAADADDLAARFVVADCLAEHGLLSESRWHLEEIVDRFEGSSNPERWVPHAMALAALARVSGAMDDRRAQLAWSDEHDAAYDPDIRVQRAWPLMKLGRFDEAMAIVDECAQSEDSEVVSAALVSRCAIEGEIGARERHHEACQASLRWSVDHHEDLAVPAHNAALSDLAVLDLAAFEADARLGLHSAGQEVSNPWAQLCAWELAQGHGGEALEAAREMQRWRLRQPPLMRDQNRAELDGVLAKLFWVAGEPERALNLVTRAIERPDRLGFSSGSALETQASDALLRISVRRSVREVDAERRAQQGWIERAWRWLLSWLPDPDELADRATVRRAMAANGSNVLRVYLFDGLPGADPWWVGDLADVVGVGVVRAALDQARELDTLPGFDAWHEAFQAELDWREGGDCGPSVAGALAGLPHAEALLRARTAAIGAACAEGRGDFAASYRLYETAMRLDPGVIRRLGLAIPARWTVPEEVASLLAASPRFRASAAGFPIVTRDGGLCLLTTTGDTLACGGPSDDARGHVDALQHAVFALPSPIARFDPDALDGTTAVSREAAADEVDRTLRELMPLER